MWWASIVGALTGAAAGIAQIHDWKGWGWLAFPADLTWGLAGSTIAVLLHVVNFIWGDHATDGRSGAHRYQSGFRLKPTYAFTQGSVMSNLTAAPGDDLFRHERLHVKQNRWFGPFFVPTYLFWMVTWFFPGLVAGAVVRAGVFQGVEKWCYFNNPWETWAYAVQGLARPDLCSTDEQKRLVWPALFVILWAIPFFLVVVFLAGVVVFKVV